MKSTRSLLYRTWKDYLADHLKVILRRKEEDERRRVGREEDLGEGIQDDEDKGSDGKSRGEVGHTPGKGFWNYSPLPYDGGKNSPTTFNAMPAMKFAKKMGGKGQKIIWNEPFKTGAAKGKNARAIANVVGEANFIDGVRQEFMEHGESLQQAAETAAGHFAVYGPDYYAKLAQINKEGIDQFGGHHIVLTFDFTETEVKIIATWDTEDIPAGLDETQTLVRIMQFIEKNLPPALAGLRNLSPKEVDIRNRTISFRGERVK